MASWKAARQARRILDEKYAAAALDSVRVRPRSGWVKAIREALGMSQASLAARLGVTRTAVTQLEAAERDGAITLTKLNEIASALGCTVVYVLLPKAPLEQMVYQQAGRVVDRHLGYVNATMALEDQAVSSDQLHPVRLDAIDAAIRRGDIWRNQ